MLEIKNITKTYSSPQGEIWTLKDISLAVGKGEFVSIIGPSGCGKSTLFNIISGLERPDRGKVLLSGQDITGQKGHTAYMLQKDLLLPWRTVLDNCILGLEVQGVARDVGRKRAEALLPEFGLEGFARSFPVVLSGGMRQRVAFLRTMLQGKEILLLDEPFGSLDAFTKGEMHEWLLGIWEKYHPTVLFITHDVDEALLLSDRVYVLSTRPATVKLDVEVKLERPRFRDLITEEKFVKLKKLLLEALAQNKPHS
ncbi:ATP-binding cassette domain-containing protein [Thermanaerosceptrum fracticalcis]|uniref:ATP-binding cassette domain-containing protein n=1 Tax=Thermanaerosceptrum fracticalcis TaxID=1712410 RepID=A0A7G6E7N5_THEFR|nr:ABC transporter ATP-binding protein [Thermanaerosceptrum fracticalcis]QNB48089.1 ATP-binding cassette domain-containing protein [Thermanaerosceptrum fracticalcis]